MLKHKKLALLLVIVLFFSSLAACADNKGNKGKDDFIVDTSGGVRAGTKDNLPDNLDFKGTKITVLIRGEENLYEAQGSIEEGSDPVHQAVYNRNLRVQARLNMEFEWATSAGSLQEVTTFMNQTLARGDYYDFILTTNNTIVSLGQNARLAEFNSASFIDLEQPWWWSRVIDELRFDGNFINYLVGDLTLGNIMKMSAFYFNKDLIQSQLGMVSEDFYQMVDEGTWTLERFYELSKRCYKDTTVNVGGSGIRDDGDLFGFPYAGGETINQFLFSCDLDLYERLPNSQISLKLKNNLKIVELTELMTEIIHNNPGAWNKTQSPSIYDNGIIQEFADGRYVFLPQRFTAAISDSMRNMESDYGILPYPVLYEGDPYRSFIQESSSCIAVPYSVISQKGFARFDVVCAVIEATCAEGYRTVTESFYDVALKKKYARDDSDSRMVDIIYDSAYKNFMLEYNTRAANVMGVLYQSVWNKDSVASRIASQADAGQRQINDFIIQTQKLYNFS